MEWLPRDELLTYEEHGPGGRDCASSASGSRRSASPAASRPSGPTCPASSRCSPRLGVDLAMTTNGVSSARARPRPGRRPGCAASTCRSTRCGRERSGPCTRRDELDRVLAGIDAALDAGLDPVKVNAVVIRGVNDDEVVDLAAFGREPRRRRCASSSSCPSTRRGEWIVDQVVPASRDPRAHRRGVHPSSRRRPSAHANRPHATATPTGAATSASSPASPSRSAATATGSASPPRASCAPACSPSTRPTCGPSLRSDRPARPCDDALADAIAGAVGDQVGRATASGRCDFIRPARSMSQIGG